MSSIVRLKNGDRIYLYESFSYRNEKGQPRNKRLCIGKVDPATDQPIYKPEYLERMASAGHPVAHSPAVSFTIDDIHRSHIREYGAFYLYRTLAERIGLLNVLRNALPYCWEEVFNLAAYLVSTGEPFSYCEDWLASTEALPVGPMTSQRISELLANITKDERDDFHHLWCEHRSEVEYLALDITSTSSYSQLIDSVEMGYNRDGEDLPQINICLLVGYHSRYPIYETVYSGSLRDVTTLQTTIRAFQVLAGKKPIIVVMDKGFYSATNIDAMLSVEQRADFIVAVPFTCDYANNFVKNESGDIDRLSNTIVHGQGSLRAVSRLYKWHNKNDLYVHIYYNARKGQNKRDELYTYVTTLRDHAMKEPAKCQNKQDYKKYLAIRRSKKSSIGYTIKIREDIVESELKTAGWMLVISNCVKDAQEAIKIYREKDIVEKGFHRLKNSLDLGRLRVHNETRMQNKVFVGFISLILLTAIHNIMDEKNLYSKMTMKKLILALSRFKLHVVKGVRIMSPLTKEQRSIFEAFGVKLPV